MIYTWFVSLTYCRLLAQFSAQLRGELLNQLLHDGINRFIVERFLGILQNEVHRITLFAFGQVLAFIHIEEFNALQ